jgi:hypothetical protein
VPKTKFRAYCRYPTADIIRSTLLKLLDHALGDCLLLRTAIRITALPFLPTEFGKLRRRILAGLLHGKSREGWTLDAVFSAVTSGRRLTGRRRTADPEFCTIGK